MAPWSVSPVIRVLAAPAVWFVYTVLAAAVVSVGCTPEFAEAEFRGIKVTLFLLGALTLTAVILIVLSVLAGMRQGEMATASRSRSVLWLGPLGLTALLGTGAVALWFWHWPCL